MKTNLLSNLSNGLKKGTGLTQVGYRQGTGKVQAGEKQACGRKESLAWSPVELISDEGAIEHPLSTHSAPFGIRWKPAGEKGSSRVWKHVAMIFAVLVMSMANVGTAWGGTTETITVISNGTTTSSGIMKDKANSQAGSTLTGCTVSLSWTTVSSSVSSTYYAQLGDNSSAVGEKVFRVYVNSGYKINSIKFYLANNQSSKTDTDYGILAWDNDLTPALTNPSYAATGATFNTSKSTFINQTETFTSLTTLQINDVRIYRKISGVTYGGNSNQEYGTKAKTIYVQKVDVTVEQIDGGGGTTYDVTYNANSGGTGTTAAQEDNANGASVTTRANGFTPNSGKKFKWWNTNAGGTGTDYYPGEALTISGADVELFAQWETVAASEEFWVGDPTTWTSSKFSVGDMDVKTNSTSKATFITDLTSTDSKVNGTDKHAKVILVADNNNYIQISFSDGSTINDLRLGITTTETSSKNAAVIYSTTEDFSTGEYETKTVSVPANNASAKSLTNFSPVTANKYKYVRIYRKVSSAVYSFTGGSGNNLRIYAIKAQKGTSCTAPSSVGISGTNKYLAGQDINLTATPTGHTGTPTYQWQKEINSVWTNVTNGDNISGATTNNLQITGCDHYNSGQYRCVVSTGSESCTTNSDAFGVHVFTVYGGYVGDTWSDSEIQFSAGTSGTATVHLNAGSLYKFHVRSNNGAYYCNGEADYNGDGNADGGSTDGWYTLGSFSNWSFGRSSRNFRIYTGAEGDYTITIDIANALVSGDYVTVSVTYPTPTHPSEGYAYFEKPNDWNGVKLYWYTDNNSRLTSWDGSPEITATTTICGTTYYYTPLGTTFSNVIFRDKGSNQWTSLATSGFSGKYLDKTTYGSPAWASFSTYTITYAANGGGGSMSATSGICPDADQAITSNAFTTPTGCASFAHWTANVAVKVGGATVAAGNPIANGATIEDINSDITLTAVWKLAAPTITDNGDNTFSISGSIGGATYYYTTNNSTPTTSSSLYSSAVDFSAGEANITAKAIAHKDGYVDSDVASQACTYHAAVTCTGDPTALVSGTLYKAQDMKSACFNTVDGDFVYGLSANDKFYITGTTNGDNSSTGTVEIKGQSKTIDAIAFDSIAWLKGSGSTTHRSIKFVTGGAGTLTVYGRTGKNAGNVQVKPSASSAVNVITASSSSQDISGTYDVTAAGTYYILSNGSSAAVYGIKFVAAPSCTTPAAPTGFSAGSITSTGATFSITDAANAASYDIYYSTSGTAPTASTPATTTSTEKTKAVTGLTASTTYYAWVRSVCDADHKSAWVALGTTSFTTSAAEPTALVTWQMKVDQAAWALKSGTTEDGTNITSIASTADEPGSTSTGITGTTGKVVMASGESNVDKAASFTFTVNSAKKVVPEKVTCKVLNVSSGNRTYKAQLSDNNGHVYYSTNTVSVTTENVLTDATFNFASSLVLTGNVTLKVYAWKTSGTPTQFRMGEYVKLFGEVQSAADYTVTHTMSNVTKSAGATSVKEGNNYTATYAGAGGYALPSTITVTIGGSPATAGTDYTWDQGTGIVTIPGNKVTGNIVITVTGVAIVHHDVDFTLTHVEYSSGDDEGTDAATEGTEFSTVFVGSTGYNLPSTITVTIDGDPATSGTDYTWNQGTGTLTIPGAKITGDITVSITGEEIPATKDIYYGAITITAGALTKGSTGTSQFFTNIGGTIANNTEISWSSGPGTGGEYYESNVLTDTELSKSSNWNTSSGSNRYVGGMKFQSGSTYTLALGSKVASSITFYGRNGSASKTMTVGGQSWTSSSTKNTFAKHQFTKSGNFTGNVTIAQDGDFYGILVITIQTAAPCTTPELSGLSDKNQCPGDNPTAWTVTVDNAATITAAGESIAYSWKKKGNDTELATTASFDVSDDVTEGQAGTYVVTVTVSKAGKASASASAEVDLNVTTAVETPSISSNKATVYAGNSVTLTATCGTAGVTWNWYKCENSDGTGAGSSLATTAAYTFAAPAAGTHYYKATASTSGTCASSASAVYTLTVSAASECENYYWFVYAADAETNGVVNNRDGFFTGAPTGSSNSNTYKFTLDGTEYKATKNTGSGSFSISFTIPEGSTATMGINCKGSSSKPLYLTHSSGTPQKLVSNSSSNASCTVEDITEGTWTLTSAGNWTLAALGVQVCTTSTCTDATPTIVAVNNTVCPSKKMRIDATGYEVGATLKWQKLNTSTSSWDDVTGETKDSLVVASVTASNAGSYRFIAHKDCDRTSNTVTITVPAAPVLSGVPSSVSVMVTEALTISGVTASDAISYTWYKSANSTLDAGDDVIGHDQTLSKPYADEPEGTYYVFCVAKNSCNVETESSAITVTVTPYVDEECAAKGQETGASFGFENTSMSSGNFPNSSTPTWNKNSNDAYLTYTAPDGKYFSKAKVTIASSNSSNASYQYSTNNAVSWTAVTISSMTTSLTERTFDLPAHVTNFRIGRNVGSAGTSSGTFYLSNACFELVDACTTTTITLSGTSFTHTFGASDFTKPTVTLGPAAVASRPVTYRSSNEAIATVDENTGDVTFQDKAGEVKIYVNYEGENIDAVNYCEKEVYYTITVICDEEAPKIVPDVTVNMSGCNASVTLAAKKQNGTSDFTGGSYQWYRDGEAIDNATNATYSAIQGGVYTVEHTTAGGCTNLSTNRATVTSETVEPEVERLTPFQYYHRNKVYKENSIMRFRHLFAVKNSGTKNGKTFEMTLKRNNDTPTDVTSSNAFVMSGDTVLIDLNKLNDKYDVDDELLLTCSAIDCSGNVSSVYKNTITIHVIDTRPTMALILSGTDNGTMEQYTAKQLMKETGKGEFSETDPWPMYTKLQTVYDVTPVNGYATFNKLNYEPYDIIFLTDFPKRSDYNKKPMETNKVNSLAELCDYRPLFTFKTHMSGLPKWAEKGFEDDPDVPKQSRLHMNLVCYAHPMFSGITGAEANELLNDHDDPTQKVYKMLTKAGYDKSKGVQGFNFGASDNFVTIGLVHYDATYTEDLPNEEIQWNANSGDKILVASAERQANLQARMVMFSLNADAHSELTETGMNVVMKCLEYLLDVDGEVITPADCWYTFDNNNGTGDHKWSTATNWSQSGMRCATPPGSYQAVRIKQPVNVDITTATAMEIRIMDAGKITIPKNGKLTVLSTIRRSDGAMSSPTEEDDIVIETAADSQGALIFNNNRGDSHATVNLYSKGRKTGDGYQFQYIAMPMGRVPVHPYFEGSDILTYAYTEAGGWERRGYYTDLYAFEGIGITTRRSTPSSFVIQGALTSTESQSLDMTYENSIPADKGYNMFGNSWSAPIQISQLGVGNEGADIQKTVYIYVTGKDPGDPTTSGDKTEVAGKWLAIPFDASGFEGWTGLKVIPAFQAFEIEATAATTLNLDYGKMVRGGTTDMNAYLRAPKRRTGETHEGIELMVLHLTGGKVNNDLFMFEGEQFSDEFDNGWEATFKEDEEIPTQLYSPTPAGKMAVAALPTLEGAKVNFTTNETGEYTFTFSGAGNAYYLNDIKEQKSALIKEGNAYVFALEEGDAPDRFYISHTPLGAPAIATGVDEVDSEALKVRKIIHNDQLYIIRGGQLYDATGKMVK